MSAPVQHMSALAHANVVRLAHGATRRSIRTLSPSEGLLRVAELLSEPVTGPNASLRLDDVLLQVRRVGPEAMRAVCKSAGCWNERIKLGTLTARQREAVVLECEMRAMR